MTNRRRVLQVVSLVLLVTLSITGHPAHAGTKVSDMARIKGQGESILIGLGIVIGLNGTGDSGDELVLARPMAQVLEQLDNPIASLDELGAMRSAALVMVQCVIPRTGARADDRFDIRVSVLHSASSLAGGELLVAPLRNSVRNELGINPAFAFAQGSIRIEDEEIPTTGVIRNGARVIRDIVTTPPVGGTFDLVVDPEYAGHNTTLYIASMIEDGYLLTASDENRMPVARAIDDRVIRVTVPPAELASPVGFVADVMATPLDPSQFKQVARVVVNTKEESIVVTGDVRISPVAVTHKNITINTTVPAPIPTDLNPLPVRERWVGLETGAPERQLTAIEELLGAFSSLDIPIRDQIELLKMVHKAGRLHGEFVID